MVWQQQFPHLVQYRQLACVCRRHRKQAARECHTACQLARALQKPAMPARELAPAPVRVAFQRLLVKKFLTSSAHRRPRFYPSLCEHDHTRRDQRAQQELPQSEWRKDQQSPQQQALRRCWQALLGRRTQLVWSPWLPAWSQVEASSRVLSRYQPSRSAKEIVRNSVQSRQKLIKSKFCI